MEEKPYLVYIRNGMYDASLPDCDGEICIENEDSSVRIYLSKEDVLKLLERFG